MGQILVVKARRHMVEGFEDKLLSKLDKLDPDQIQNYITHLLGQKQLMQTVFDRLDEGIVVADLNLRVLFINRRARSMLGMSRVRSIVGEDLVARIPVDHRLAPTIESLRGHLRPIECYECPYGPRDQRTVSISTLLMRAPDSDDEENQLLILLLRDVTDRVQSENEKARARRLSSMATLTSGIAHEIKNPLNSLNIHAQILESEIEKQRARGAEREMAPFSRASKVILEETARLARIIEQFLLAARPVSPSLEPRELRDLFEQLDRIFRPECERSGIDLRFSTDPDVPRVLIDEHLMLQALRNLARNAIDALRDPNWRATKPPEQFVPRLSIESRLAADSVQIIVQDNGPGIPEGTIEHIFEPYYTTKPDGTGLGLMVVYRIVAEHRGALHVDTHPGEGSQFIILLPLHQKPVRLLSHETENAPIVVQGKTLKKR